MLKSQKLTCLSPQNETDSDILTTKILEGEIEGVDIDYITIKNSSGFKGLPGESEYDLIFILEGDVIIEVEGEKYSAGSPFIVRLPYNMKYSVTNGKSYKTEFLHIRKSLDEDDRKLILENNEVYKDIFIKALDDCPVYTEDIKSSKSINRILLPEGMIPRLCIGYVETTGPDTVAEHEHPMLDQLFLGMKDCNCLCKADGSSILLTENLMVHIPLGSKHSVIVEKGSKLAYIWFDFFLTIEGQEYISTQHRMEEE